MQQPPIPPAPVGPAKSPGMPRGLKLALILIGVFLVMTAGIAYANRWIISYLTSTSPHSITYEVTGSGTAEVVYTAPDGQHRQTVTLPWSTTLTVPDGSQLGVTAGGSTGGFLTCRIQWEGHTIQFDSGSGNGPTCTALGTA
jgi:MmpS family membrane protein